MYMGGLSLSCMVLRLQSFAVCDIYPMEFLVFIYIFIGLYVHKKMTPPPFFLIYYETPLASVCSFLKPSLFTPRDSFLDELTIKAVKMLISKGTRLTHTVVPSHNDTEYHVMDSTPKQCSFFSLGECSMPAPKTIDPNILHLLFTYNPTEGLLVPKPDAVATRAVKRISNLQWKINGANYSTHRLIWAYHNPTNANPHVVEYVDGNRNNVRIENLRGSNEHSGRFRSTGRPRLVNGVNFNPHTGKFSATYMKAGEIVLLGEFDTSAAAIDALRKYRLARAHATPQELDGADMPHILKTPEVQHVVDPDLLQDFADMESSLPVNTHKRRTP